nr:MAG TPA: hypothetical protein [Caudoviricetes sp.]
MLPHNRAVSVALICREYFYMCAVKIELHSF